jgi:hypothetical protein
MRLDLLDRLRTLSIRRRETIEATLNRAIEIGLPAMELEARREVVK